MKHGHAAPAVRRQPAQLCVARVPSNARSAACKLIHSHVDRAPSAEKEIHRETWFDGQRKSQTQNISNDNNLKNWSTNITNIDDKTPNICTMRTTTHNKKRQADQRGQEKAGQDKQDRQTEKHQDRKTDSRQSDNKKTNSAAAAWL